MQNQVRIIAGKWRGRKIHFPEYKNLRPTPDRVRETLFNWLAPYMLDARCLDLFAGSGILGFEALSRGAKQVVALDEHPECIQSIRENRMKIGKEAEETLKIIQTNTLNLLKREIPDITHTNIKTKMISNENQINSDSVQSINATSSLEQFDIVFVDPPYELKLGENCFNLLENYQWLKNEAFIYYESNEPLDKLLLPTSWECWRESRAGKVYYAVFRRNINS